MSKITNKISGTLIATIGIVLGLYIGGYLLFIGGLIQAYQGLISSSATDVGGGLCKVIFAWPIGLVCALPFIWLGGKVSEVK